MPAKLRFGLTGMSGGEISYPEALTTISHAAEAAGFDSLWAGEHIILPDSSTRMPPTYRCLNPLLTLTYIATQTKSIRLGTGVLLLPQHEPLLLAKELATLDVLSGGRVIVGIGVGWSEEEYQSLGIPYNERGVRADEYLAAMRTIWSEEKPVFHGKYVSFQGVQAHPHPIQQPHPPIITGGRAPAVIRRTIEQANGWYGYAYDLDDTAAFLSQLREAANRYHRPDSLGEIEISIAPRIPIDKETARRFAELGVHRLVFIPPPEKDTPALAQWITTLGETLVGQV